MATNVSYASGDSELESLVLHTLPHFGEHGDGIINNNFLLAALQLKGRKKVRDGGLEFWNGIIKGESSNFKWQGKSADMTADTQDPNDRLRYDIKVFTGSVVINKLDAAKNKGRAMIKKWLETLNQQADSTIKNQFNSAFWDTSPASDNPNSVPSIITSTPTAGTIGGLNRSGNAHLQNVAYTTAVSDIGSEAGITALKQQQLKTAIGSGGRDSVDVMITTDTLYGSLQGYLATLNRFRNDDQFAKLDFETIKLGKAVISYENTTVSGGANSIAANQLYGINTNHFAFELLKDGNFQWSEKFERVGLTLNKALYFWVFCNLTTDLPKAHFVMTNVS